MANVGNNNMALGCDPFDAFYQYTEHLGEEIHLRAYWRSVWLNLIPRARFPLEVGLNISTYVMGLNYPDSVEENWECISSSGVTCNDWSDSIEDYDVVESGSGMCKVCWNDTHFGSDQTWYGAEQFGLRGPIICQDDLLFNHNPERFLELYLRGLSKRVQLSFDNRLKNAYMHLVPKWVADASFAKDDDGGSLSGGCVPQSPDLSALTPPTSELTQEMLDEVAQDLIEQGATDPDSDGWIQLGEAGPVFTLSIGMRASKQIQLNNSDLRSDYNFSYAAQKDANPVIRRLAAPRVIGNFAHQIELFPPRWNYYTGIGWIRIPDHITVAASQGNKSIINPQWKTAAYEGALVLSPHVMTDRVIPARNSAANLSWTPKNYMGEMLWVTGGKEICDDTDDAEMYDPTKKLGRHFMEYKHGIEPVFPEYGALIVFKRCPTTSFETVTCVS